VASTFNPQARSRRRSKLAHGVIDLSASKGVCWTMAAPVTRRSIRHHDPPLVRHKDLRCFESMSLIYPHEDLRR
jgi:hypothetical protein